MSRHCSKCSAAMDPQWSFCPHCAGQIVKDPPKQEHHERAPARYVVSGVILGFITCPVLIIYGTLICLLGPPMVLGIPLIILGILAPFVGPYLAINAVRGKCPWCETKLSTVGPINAFYCHACSKPIEVREHEMFRGHEPVIAP